MPASILEVYVASSIYSEELAMADSKPTAAEIGALGGKARAEAMTPDERSEQARRAVDARWNPDKSKE